ncbi:MAG: bifunctional (p)ppGpp synthetase/guanosine-3',5'-bis(diphosphate) 3'-pyrophosphohydrolase [Paludibacteraceae bacterium]|nr:bifunctional (p)ppGpp synthetase/guanosine-3',5'-bis(diphosphate) 3'-pyrophosphohydrolase [Paludibacteraceae bacterium]
MKQSNFTQDEELMIERAFEDMLASYNDRSVGQVKTERIRQAFHFAHNAHYGVRRLSGEPYILHPIAVAKICAAEIGLGSTSICAALLHDVVEDTDYTVDDIRNLFGDQIAVIVDGLTKISGGLFGDQVSEQAENFRKLLLTMTEDIRVVLIKTADRLHNMRTLGSQPKNKQYKIAGETQFIYAPLAHRLGLFPIKTELEDLSFKYQHPKDYAEIEAKLEAVREEQMKFFDQFSAPIREKLQSMGYEFEVRARIKTVYSIWSKMQSKQVPFEDVYDILAVRIIFKPNESLSEKDQCWMIYSAITELYHPHPGRIRDWISTPKANGYEALHVTVMSKDGKWVEIQIRTQRMNMLAEQGLAAHWKYKTGDSDDSQLEGWLHSIQEALQNPEKDASEFVNLFRNNLFVRELFVFTPTGEVKTMPQGATALDFAYLLHTNLGEHCIGAKVNHNLVPLSYQLKGGDQVEILSSTSQHPQREWLNWCVTAKAQSALHAYFRREETRYSKHGEKLFNDAVSMMGEEQNANKILHRMLNHYHLTQPHQLYMQIGQGFILLDNMQDIVNAKKGWWKRMFSSNDTDNDTPPVEQEQKPIVKPEKGKAQTIVISDENLGKLYHLSDCCRPIPGDEVLGYLAPDGTMQIHKIDCHEAQVLKSSFGKRIYSATWNTHRVQSFIETIEIQGIDKFGVLIQMLKTLTEQFRINMHAIHLMSNDGIFEGQIELYVYDRNELYDLFKALRKIPEIKSVKRIENKDN